MSDAEKNEVMEKSRERSVAYPFTDLKASLGALESLRNNLGKGPFNRESAAKGMGYTGISGTSSRMAAALVHFGLIIKSGGGYAVSELSDKILFPTSAEEKMEAISEAAKEPKLYGLLLERFADKPLPSMLEHILYRDFGINQKVAEEVAKTFKETAEFAGLLKNGIVLKKLENASDNISSPKQQITGSDISHEDSDEVHHEAEDRKSDNSFTLPLSKGVVIIFPKRMILDVAMGKFKTAIEAFESILGEPSEKENSQEETASDLS